jgi:hypothetical protein
MNEKCARTVCNNPHDNCKHTDHLGRLYCLSCARKINKFHLDTHPNGLITIPMFGIVEFLGKKYRRTGIVRKPKRGEVYWARLSAFEAQHDFNSEECEILEELPEV